MRMRAQNTYVMTVLTMVMSRAVPGSISARPLVSVVVVGNDVVSRSGRPIPKSVMYTWQ